MRPNEIIINKVPPGKKVFVGKTYREDTEVIEIGGKIFSILKKISWMERPERMSTGKGRENEIYIIKTDTQQIKGRAVLFCSYPVNNLCRAKGERQWKLLFGGKYIDSILRMEENNE
jgi:hypothetical protein